MTGWDVFFPLVMVEAPGCPEPTAAQYLRMTARDFCKRSRAWVQALAPVIADGVASQFTIVLDPAWQGELVRIVGATLNGKPLEVKSAAVLSRQPRPADCCGSLLDQGDGTYRIDRAPAAGGTLLMHAALMPTFTADQCAAVLSTSYPQAIADGALGRLLALANVPFANPIRAMDCRASYEKQLHAASNTDFLRAAPDQRRVQPSPL